jgi:hypothetical protein
LKKDEEIDLLKSQVNQQRASLQHKDEDIDLVHKDNFLFKNELDEERQRSNNRERDIEGLEQVVNDLKESMGREYQMKCHDYDNLRMELNA